MPYYNEELVLRVRLDNGLYPDTRLCLVESDYTFKYGNKGYNFPGELKDNPHIDYYQLDGRKKFLPNNKLSKLRLLKYRFSESAYKRTLSIPTWFNEARQRNYIAEKIHPLNSDYVILCDVDEIVDMAKLDMILREVDKREIVTCKLRFTMFYFDLFVQGWGGPEDYSYRMFIMTGEYFNKLWCSSDEMRKAGERKQLLDKIYCIDDFCGFHHSWLGDTETVLKKMRAYAHSFEEHTGTNEEFIDDCIRNGKPFFEGVSLKYDESISLLPAVERLKETRADLFWKNEKMV